MILDRLFDIGLVLVVLGLATALGLWLLRRLRLTGLSALEELLFATGLGLGILAYSVLALGLIGWFNTPALLLVLAAASLPGVFQARTVARLLGRVRRELYQDISPWPVPIVLLILLLIIVGFVLLQSLAYPTSWDALLYHLGAPRYFIAHGGIVPWPENNAANSPLTVGMLYSIGLLLGSDVFAKVLHFAFGLGCAAVTYAIARRCGSARAAWLGVFLYLSTPLVFLSFPRAYADLALTFFILLAILAFLLWSQSQEHMARERRRLVLLCATSCGIALGIKLTAGFSGLLLALAIVIWTLAFRRREWKGTILDLAILATVAGLIAAPWYVKNWLWFGNPIYPMIFGGPEWNATRSAWQAHFMASFGCGHGILDYLLLPWNLLVHADRFGTAFFSYSSPLIWLPLLLLVTRRRSRELVFLLAFSYGQLVLWFASSQAIRWYLPYLAPLCIVLGALLDWLLQKWPRPWAHRGVFYTLITYAMVGLVLQQLFFWLDTNPLPSVLGLESRHAYLTRVTSNYKAITYINEHTPPDATVLLIGDGQCYYVQRDCIPDAPLDNWSYMASLASTRTPEAVLEVLCDRAITHILRREYSPIWLAQFDEPGTIRADVALFDSFREQYLECLFADGMIQVYRVKGQQGSSQ